VEGHDLQVHLPNGLRRAVVLGYIFTSVGQGGPLSSGASST